MHSPRPLPLTGQPANEPGRKRKNARRAMRLAVEMHRGHGPSRHQTRATILDLSRGGMLFECDSPLSRGEWVDVELPLAGLCRIEIIWAADLLYGCRFEYELADAAVFAAHTAGARSHNVDKPDAELARSLVNARQRTGLSLEALARKLGVSKQTVWFWEKGRHSPTPDRLRALHEVLGLLHASTQGIATDSDGKSSATGPLTRLVTKAKEDIAAAAGTSTDRISITIAY